MEVQLAIVAPLIGLAAMLSVASRRDPARRARQEAAWREMILTAGLLDRFQPEIKSDLEVIEPQN
ncbi:hypothetical protein [Sphingomonas radiodurans]|uniref:hypothetical protein n=1 Tax=Sphingomonas radiodurans TaxID=2890321 RepID=UPI001E598D96|nr:hypothetical protein [Sphingomonas radiodurans]WBH16729.1 hypothetical protein LLW23_00975 [Sphingomonas radiodurans]